MAVFLIGYAVVHLALARGSARTGSPPATVRGLLQLIARLSPWGRRDDGRLVLRNPLVNATVRRPARAGRGRRRPAGLDRFDGLSRTVFWQTGPGAANDSLSGTVGLLVMIALVGGALRARRPALGPAGRPAGGHPAPPVRGHGHPIALGYTVAHYFSLLMLDGQTTWILASNPFGVPGFDLFGTYGNVVDLTGVSADASRWCRSARSSPATCSA